MDSLYGLWIPGTGFRIQDSGVLVNATLILDSNRSRYSGFPELNSTSKTFQDSTIRIFLYGATHFMLFKILLVALNTVFAVEF